MINFEQVTKEFVSGVWKKSRVTALDNVTVKFPSNKIIGILGENGAGKTTMVKLISGLLLPTIGHVSIDEMNWKQHRRKLYRLTGTMLEGGRTTHWPLSVRQNLEYFGVLRGVYHRELRENIESAIDFFGLRDKADVPVKALSKGMKQKLALAIAMIHSPKKLLLDEPVSGIDYATSILIQERLKEWVRKEGNTVLITTHDMHVAQNLCDRIIIIRKGQIITDDNLDNLMSLFSGRKYYIRFTNQVIGGIDCIQLGSKKIETIWNKESGTLKFILDDHYSIDELIEHLASRYGSVKSIQSERAQLGDIYSKLVSSQ